MRKFSFLVLVMVLAVPSTGDAATTQRVEGEVLAAAGPVLLATWNASVMCDLASSTTQWAVGLPLPCSYVPVVDACDAIAGPNGTTSYRFSIDPDTRGRPFRLSTTDVADLQITFRGSSTKRIDRNSVFAGNIGAETGKVPAGAQTADVCLMVGARARFTYVAG